MSAAKKLTPVAILPSTQVTFSPRISKEIWDVSPVKTLEFKFKHSGIQARALPPIS